MNDIFVPFRDDILCTKVLRNEKSLSEEELHILAVMAINSIVNIYNMYMCEARKRSSIDSFSIQDIL